jgi:hypothetical protein
MLEPGCWMGPRASTRPDMMRRRLRWARRREAVGEGFEPPVSFPTPVFKTGALNHSATQPKLNL